MESVVARLIAEHRAAADRMDEGQQRVLIQAARLLCDAFRAGCTVYVCGNGGSAADAQHIAAELTGRYLRDRKALPCIALTTDTSLLTAVANDLGYEEVFARQVAAFVRPGDVLWAISTSGTSPNVIKAVHAARGRGGRILGFTGKTGGELARLCDLCFIAPAESTYCIQQLHVLAYHVICDLVEREADALV